MIKDKLLHIRLRWEGRKIKMNRKEKSQIRDEIFQFISKYPIENPDRARESFAHVAAQRAQARHIKNFAPLRVALASTLVVIVCGVVAVQAEEVSPGHLLYPVKINFNEKVVKALTLSTEGKAQWEVERTRRRLEEAEELVLANKLDAHKSQYLAQQMNSYVSKATYDAVELETRGNADTSIEIYSQLESTLRAHEGVLARIQNYTANEIDTDALGNVSSEVSKQLLSVQLARSEVENQITAHADTKTREEVEIKLSEAQTWIVRSKEAITRAKQNDKNEHKITNAEMRLKRAQAAFEEGKEHMDVTAFDDAFISFHTAIRVAREVYVSTETSSRLRLTLELLEENKERENSKEIESSPSPKAQATASPRAENKDEKNTLNTSVKVNIKTEAEIQSENNTSIIEASTKVEGEAGGEISAPKQGEINISIPTVIDSATNMKGSPVVPDISQ